MILENQSFNMNALYVSGSLVKKANMNLVRVEKFFFDSMWNIKSKNYRDILWKMQSFAPLQILGPPHHHTIEFHKLKLFPLAS